MIGDKDDPVLIASNQEAARRIPEADHYPTIREPQLVLDAILRHCANRDAPPDSTA
jgi:hypothetical protein